MYSTCLFCHADLGRNEAIEIFPVGRRLAFDPAKGRLWVVCRKCERWNLSPLEERWEAIEECERRFHDTRLRVSTDNIGLAKLREGLELVRIGAPQRPEFAAWRYGDQFGRRRRRTLIMVGGGLAVVGAAVTGAVTAGVGIGGFGYGLHQLARFIVRGNPRQTITEIDVGGVRRVIRRADLSTVTLQRGGTPLDWSLRLQAARHPIWLEGREAERAAAQLLPAINRFGGTRADVNDAVRLIESAPSPMHVVDAARRTGSAQPIASLAAPQRLALEMIAHEEQERRALEGELADLERAWKDAEEIAAISDDLFTPSSVLDRLASLRHRVT